MVHYIPIHVCKRKQNNKCIPIGQHEQVRTLLSFVLSIVAQQLIPKTFESGRVLGMEILYLQMRLNLIRENKTHGFISNASWREKTGMITMNQSLKKSVDSGLIDIETALNYTTAQDELTKMLGLKEGKRK